MSIKNRLDKGIKYYLKIASEVPDDQLALLSAIAAMIEHKETKAKKEPKLKVSPQYVHSTLRSSCPNRLAFDTYASSDFARLGKTMEGLSPPVVPEDVTAIADWIHSGGLSFFTGKVAFTSFVRNFPSWLAKARDFAKDNHVGPQESNIR